MSDSLSPENLGKDLYIAHAIDVRGVTQKTAIDEWINQYSEEGKQDWSNAAERFCKYLKAAKADS
jgi:hypothetical protein